MSHRAGAVVFIGLCAVALLAASRPYNKTFSRDEWKGMGRALSFRVIGYRGEERGRTIAVFEKHETLYEDRDRGFHPWKIEVCELDGDSLPEVAVGVYKKTRFDPVDRNRLFVFDFTGEDGLYAKWLGSRLGLPFLDYTFVRGDEGHDRLISIEHRDRELLLLRRYYYGSFGFVHDRDLMIAQRPRDFGLCVAAMKAAARRINYEEVAGNGGYSLGGVFLRLACTGGG